MTRPTKLTPDQLEALCRERPTADHALIERDPETNTLHLMVGPLSRRRELAWAPEDDTAAGTALAEQHIAAAKAAAGLGGAS